jgi:hypothetical protein
LLTLDTIQLTTSTDYIRDLNKGKFTVSNIIKSNGIKIINKTLECSIDGLQRLSINETKGTVKIKCSSKILGLDYPKGISINTIEKLISKVNSTGIKLNYDLINDSTLNFVDVKSDITLSKEPNVYFNSLNLLVAPKFVKTLYKTGIVFNEGIKQNPIRTTIYGKEYETQANKKFYLSNPGLSSYFDNVIRIESRLKNKPTIVKYLNSNSLVEVLASSNLNYNILSKIIDKQTEIRPLYNTKEMTNTQEKNFAQIYYLNEMYNGNFERIMAHIKNKLGDNTKATYQRKKVKKYLAIINNAKGINTLNNINEFKNALIEN